MAAQKKLTKVQEAMHRCDEARKTLASLGGRCMEATDDKAGIVWERWIVRKDHPMGSGEVVNVVLWATPFGWDLFTPISNSVQTEDTLSALRTLAQ